LVVAVDHGFRELFILKDCKIGFFGRKKMPTGVFAHNLHFIL
jgi:hypothetical protein